MFPMELNPRTRESIYHCIRTCFLFMKGGSRLISHHFQILIVFITWIKHHKTGDPTFVWGQIVSYFIKWFEWVQKESQDKWQMKTYIQAFDCSDVHFIGPKCNEPNKRKTSNQRISHIYYFYLVEGAFSSFRSGLRKGSCKLAVE